MDHINVKDDENYDNDGNDSHIDYSKDAGGSFFAPRLL